MAFLAFQIFKRRGPRLDGLKKLWLWKNDAKVFSGARNSFLVSRISNHRTIVLFFVLALLHFILHAILQTFILSTDITKHTSVWEFADLPTGMFVSFEDSRWLKGCNETMDVMAGFDGKVRGCPVLFDARATPAVTSGGVMVGMGDTGMGSAMGMTNTRHGLCDILLLWAYQTFHNEVRTDGAFIALEAWLLFVSIAALAGESVPHLIASVVIRLLSTAWSLWAILETYKHKSGYRTLITSPLSPCALYTRRTPGFLSGMDKMTDLDPLFTRRIALDIVVFILNVLVFIAITVVSWRIYRIWQEQHFEHVGVTDEVQKLYKWLTLLSASLHLATFVVLVSISLWIDRLFSVGGYHLESEPLQFYRILSAVMAAFAVVWLASGHIGVRSEMRKTTIVFLAGGILLLAAYMTMFTSVTFRTFFTTWSFFSTMCFASFGLIVMAFVVGLICRRNFGKGLKHYLHVRRVLANSHFPAERFTDTSRPVSETMFVQKMMENNNMTMKSFIQQPQPIKLTLGTTDTRECPLKERGPATEFDGALVGSPPFGGISVGEAEYVIEDDYKTWMAYQSRKRDSVATVKSTAKSGREKSRTLGKRGITDQWSMKRPPV